MKINTIKILLSIVLVNLYIGFLFAQQPIKVITGIVEDEFGPLVSAYVVEINKDKRIISQTATDVNGKFTLAVKNPKDNKIQISYIGCKTQVLPIKSTPYNVYLESSTTLKEVTVSAGKKVYSSGLDIPEREMSMAAQQISTKEFEGFAVTSIDEALQGRIAGLDITFNSGNLGSGTSMRLRGVSSINGSSDPLIVVDGNIWESDYKNGFDFNSATEDQYAELLSVNPEDIESITVLKDAAATAIWGAQGANGVIEIKKKRGVRGPTRVSYSYRIKGTYQPKGIEMLTGDEYTMYLKEAYFNPELNDAASNIIEINYPDKSAFADYQMFNNNTDWYDAVTKTGWEQQHYLSIQGGGERANFRISGGFDTSTGSIIGQELKRFTTSTALDYFVSSRIKVVTNFGITFSDNYRNNGDLLAIAYKKMPNLAIYEEDDFGNSIGEYYHIKSTMSNELSDQRGLVNPVALAYEAKNREKAFSISPEFRFIYDILGVESDKTRLNYEGSIIFNIFNKYNDTFYPSSLVTAGWSDANNNNTSSNSHKSFAYTTRHTLNLKPVFSNTDHSLMAMARFEVTSGTSNTQSNSLYGLPFGTIASTSVDATIQNFSTSSGEWRKMAGIFSTNYSYKGKYIAYFSMRSEGSTKYGESNRWGNFPGASLRWNISDEKFLDSFNWLSMLSIRGGWGINGTPPGSEYLYFSKYASGDEYLSNGSIYASNIALNKLKWEERIGYNLGFDFGFFNDMINGNINIYTEERKDMIMANYPLPTSSGFPSLTFVNAGNMKNNGWELVLNANRIAKVNKFSIDLNMSFADNKNEITKMDPTLLESLNRDFDKQNGSYLTRVQLNNPFGAIYGFRSKGVYQYSEYSDIEVPGVSGPNAPVARDNQGNVILDEKGKTKPMYFCFGTSQETEFSGGDAIYEDINNDGNINELDIVYLGSSLPKLTGGFGFKLSFGRLSWNNQFNFRYGNKIVNAARMHAESMSNNNNQSRAVNWRWRVEGDMTDVPRAFIAGSTNKKSFNYLGSDRFIEDGSFIRLNYSSINYSVDPKYLKAYGINALSFFVTGSNVFCLTKYSGADPEVGYGGYSVATDNARTPRSISYTFGLKVQF